MKLALLFIVPFLLLSCSSLHIERTPSAFKAEYSCENLISFIIKTPKKMEVEKLSREEMQVLNVEKEIYTSSVAFKRYLPIERGFIDLWQRNDYSLDMFSPRTLLDSNNKEWIIDHILSNKIFLRMPDSDEVVEYRLRPLDVIVRKVTIQLKEDKTIILRIPDGNEELYQAFLSEVLDKMTELPKEFIDSLEHIMIVPSKYQLTGRAMATADNREINFYLKNLGKPFSLPNYTINKYVLQHEFGHILAHKLYKSATPPEAWKKAMKLDKVHVSSYAETNDAEDFAETVAIYLDIDEKDGIRDERWKMFSHRFAELDKIFYNNPNLRYEMQKALFVREKLPRYTILFTLSSGAFVATNITPTDEK